MTTFDLQHAAMAIPDASPAEKHVLLVLALRADMAASQCTPGIPRIARDTGLSERSVHRAIVALEKSGHIAREIKPGVGTIYTVHPRHCVTPDSVSPLTQCHETPDTVSSKLPRTTNTQKTTSSSRERGRAPARATAFPEGFAPVLSGPTAAVVAGWPPGRMETEIEAMADWHAKEGKLSKDWQASWRTWVRNSTKWDARNEQSRSSGRSPAGVGTHKAAILAAYDSVSFE